MKALRNELQKFAEILETATGHLRDLWVEQESLYFDKSEKWQESEPGETRRNELDEIESFLDELDNLTVPENDN